MSGWDSDPGFPVTSDGCMDGGHPYYYQLQHQMLVTGFEKKNFCIWTRVKTDNFILITVKKDNSFLKKLTVKFDHPFKVVILLNWFLGKVMRRTMKMKNCIVYANDLAFSQW